jgi:hypothetical protein
MTAEVMPKNPKRTIKYHAQWFQSFGLIIMDEGHRIVAKQTSSVFCSLKSHYQLLVTATPFRTDGLDEHICMIGGPIVFSSGPKYIPTRVHLVKCDLTAIAIDPKTIRPYVMAKLLGNSFRNRLIVTKILKLVNTGHHVLVMSERRAHLHRLKALLYEVLPTGLVQARVRPGEKKEMPMVPFVGISHGDMDPEEKEKAKLSPVFLTTYALSGEFAANVQAKSIQLRLLIYAIHTRNLLDPITDVCKIMNE